MRPQIVKILTLVLFVFNSISMLAQNAGPPTPTNERRPPQNPIDDQIIILIVMGLIFGAYIAYKKHQAKNTPA